MTTHYLLSCSISADVRQSVQIKFDDLKLPQSVIETLKKNNTVSIRPHLSNALKTELDALRIRQRELYDSYCIHYGDSHFVTSNYFYDARNLIKSIRLEAEEANERLKEIWQEEYERWQATTEGILRPLFVDDQEYKLAYDAYMKFFPPKGSYQKAIRVNVLGPLPISLERVDAPVEDDIDSVIAYENTVNTQQVLEAAKQSAAERALSIGAQLIDDLDARPITKIGKQQTGSEKKRGSWEVTVTKLKLISDSVPGFEYLANLSQKMLDTGMAIQSDDYNTRKTAKEQFRQIQEDIRKELENICQSRDETRGLEKLKQSLALSTSYKYLCDRIQATENAGALNLLMKDVNTELDIYEQRSKHLKKLLSQRKELIEAANQNIDELIEEVQSKDDVPVDF